MYGTEPNSLSGTSMSSASGSKIINSSSNCSELGLLLVTCLTQLMAACTKLKHLTTLTPLSFTSITLEAHMVYREMGAPGEDRTVTTAIEYFLGTVWQASESGARSGFVSVGRVGTANKEPGDRCLGVAEVDIKLWRDCLIELDAVQIEDGLGVSVDGVWNNEAGCCLE